MFKLITLHFKGHREGRGDLSHFNQSSEVFIYKSYSVKQNQLVNYCVVAVCWRLNHSLMLILFSITRLKSKQNLTQYCLFPPKVVQFLSSREELKLHDMSVSPHSPVRMCAHNQRRKRNVSIFYWSAASEVACAAVLEEFGGNTGYVSFVLFWWRSSTAVWQLVF